MAPADTWAELARRFREESVRYPNLHHLLIEYPECHEVPDDSANRKAKKAATERFKRLSPAIGLASLVALDPRFRQGQRRLMWHHLGQEHIFFEEPSRDAAPGWRPLVKLARRSIKLMSNPPDQEADDWPGRWMSLVYKLARERRPDWIEEWSDRKRRPLPKGMRIAELSDGVFIISAYAAELLAGDAEIRQKAGKSPSRPTGGRPSDTDHDGDRRIADAWHMNKYATKADLAREMGKNPSDVKRAIDRHRKRKSPGKTPRKNRCQDG
jgi:hypothetical protein